MKNLSVVIALCLAIMMGGCADLNSFKKAELPASLRGASLQLVSVRPTKDIALVNAYEVPERSIFFTQSSGGSLAVGLLFGPLGVLANTANIERLTQEMGKSGGSSSLFQLDALQEAAIAWSSPVQNNLPEDFPGISLKPFIALTVRDETIGVNTIVGFRAEGKYRNAQGALENWVGHYNYVLETAQHIDALSKPLSDEALALYRDQVRTGFSEIRKELVRDLSSAEPPKRKIALVNSSFQWAGMGGPGDIELDSAGRLSLRTSFYKSLYTATIFPSSTMYTFLGEPIPREENNK